MNWRPQKYTQISNALRRYFFQVDLIFDRKSRDYKIENKDFYQQWYSLTVCKYIHSSIGASLAVFWYWFQILYAWIVRYTLKWRLIYMFQHCMIAILSKYTILTRNTKLKSLTFRPVWSPVTACYRELSRERPVTRDSGSLSISTLLIMKCIIEEVMCDIKYLLLLPLRGWPHWLIF